MICAVLVTSCGGSDDDDGVATCGTFAACGGAVVGSWTVEKTCAQSTTVPTGFCGDVNVDLSSVQGKGDVTFAADGTYTGGITVDGTVKLEIPSACLTFQGRSFSCIEASGALQILLGQRPELAGLTFACNGTNTCTCAGTFPSTPQTTGGTYVVSGTTLTLTPTGEAAQPVPFCAKGKRLEGAFTPAGAPAAGAGATRAYVILRKK